MTTDHVARASVTIDAPLARVWDAPPRARAGSQPNAGVARALGAHNGATMLASLKKLLET